MSEFHHDPQQHDFNQAYAVGEGQEFDFSAGYGQEGAEWQGHGHEGGHEQPGHAGGYDENATYGDHGPEGYQEHAAYGDHGPEGYHDGQAEYQEGYAHEGQHEGYGEGYEQGHEGYGHEGYEQGYEGQQGYAEGYEEGYADPEADDEPAGRPGRLAGKKKTMIMAGLGIVLIGALGGAGYFFFVAPGQDASNPVAPAAASSDSGFSFSSLLAKIPFLGPKDSDDTRSADQDNATTIKRAIDAYVRDQGALPRTPAAINAELRKLKKAPKNPYKPSEPVTVELADQPSGPGAIAIALKGTQYAITVGNVSGKPLDDGNGQTFSVAGRMPRNPGGQASASKPAPVAAAKPNGAKIAAAPAKGAKPSAPNASPTPTAVAVVPGAKGAKAPTGKKPDTLAAMVAALQSPSPSPNVGGELATAAEVRRNQEFDRWRIKGISLVYEQKTTESIAAFKHALALRPNDASVTRWLDIINAAIEKHTAEAKEQYEKEKEAAQHGNGNAQPPQFRFIPGAQPGSMPSLPKVPGGTAPGLAPNDDGGVGKSQSSLKSALSHIQKVRKETAPVLPAPKLDN